MAKLTFLLPTLALVVYHTGIVSTDNTTDIQPEMTTDGIEDLTSSTGISLACPLRLATQVARVVLGCTGVLFNSLAIVVVGRDKKMSRSFRVVLFSLTLADMGFAVTSVLAGCLAIGDGYDSPWTTTSPHDSTASSVTCNILTALYHSLLGCGATTTLSLGLDRMTAVFAPVRYRSRGVKCTFLGCTATKTAAGAILPSWALVLLCVVTLPPTWSAYGNGLEVGSNAMSCWPLIAVPHEFLVLQAILLLTAVVGATVAYFCTIHKLTRRAILVVPFFVHRTSDSTAAERLETRRSATHAASQAFGFCVLILPFGGYLFWLATTTADRVSEACEGRFLFMSLFPAVHNMMSPLLTLWRLRNYPDFCPDLCPTSCPRTSGQVEPHPHPATEAKPMEKNKGSSTLKTPDRTVFDRTARATVDKMEVSSEMSTEEEEKAAVTQKKDVSPCKIAAAAAVTVATAASTFTFTPSSSSTSAAAAAAAAAADEDEFRVDSTPGPESQEVRPRESRTRINYSPPRDNYGNDDCRADPSLLNATITLI